MGLAVVAAGFRLRMARGGVRLGAAVVVVVAGGSVVGRRPRLPWFRKPPGRLRDTLSADTCGRAER